MPMTQGQRRLYSGDYNSMQQDRQPDGTVIVTVSGGRTPLVHRMHIRDLWGENEEVLSEEKVNNEVPEWLLARLEWGREGRE